MFVSENSVDFAADLLLHVCAARISGIVFPIEQAWDPSDSKWLCT